MWKKILCLVLFCSLDLSAQTTISRRVSEQAGATMAEKVTAAQTECTGGTTCTIIFDIGLPKIPGENIGSPCSNCTWIDYRTPHALKIGTSLPETCNVGEEFFKTDSTPGQNKYGCTAANTWLLQGDGGGGAAWGGITGTLSNQTDLQTALDGKQNSLGFTPENVANKNAPSGYAGLDGSSKLNAAQGQEVWAIADLSDFAAKSGSGTTVIGATFTSLAANDLPIWNGTNWVNSTAAPKATALGSTPSLCPSGQAPTGILANGNATGCTTITGGGSSIAYLTADTAGSSSNTLVNTGMAFSLAANTIYTMDCMILFTVSATSGVGLTLGVSGPGTPTQVTLMRLMNTTATAFRLDSSATATWGAKVGTTATTVTSLSRAHFTGLIENGTTAGTMNVQFANIGTTGSTVVKRGSFCRLQ